MNPLTPKVQAVALKKETHKFSRTTVACLATLLCLANQSYGQANDERSFFESPAAKLLPDFSYAGYGFGVGEIPGGQGKVLNAEDFGVVTDDGNDDSEALLKALAAAHEVKSAVTLQLPKGRLIVSEILPVTRSDITIRGYGSGGDGTEIHFPRPLAAIDKTDRLKELRVYLEKYDKRQREPENNIDELFSEYSWTGGFFWIQKPGARAAAYLTEYDPEIEQLASIQSGERGGKRLTVSDPERLQIGDAVQIHWFNRDGENGALVTSIYGETDLDIGSHHWSFPDRPLVRQTTRIVAINGNVVEIGDPLLHDISPEMPAQFSRWDHLENVGLEDFAITFPESPSFGHHLERGYNGIYVTSVIDGWVRDVRIVNADSGILTYNSANLTIERIRTQGERWAHYAVHLGNVHNVLARDLLIENPVRHSLTFNTQSTKSVFQRARVLREPVLDQHAGSNHQNLFDQITLHVNARDSRRGLSYPIWDGSGAGYWQPGHGRFNTTWNLNVVVESGGARDEKVALQGLAEGPDAFIIGVHGNREFSVDYRPEPKALLVNQPPGVASLYDWQLQSRMKNFENSTTQPNQ